MIDFGKNISDTSDIKWMYFEGGVKLNENNKDNPNKKNNGTIQNVIILIVVTLIFTMLLNSAISHVKNGTKKEITYDKFLEMVEKDEIKSVQIKSDQIVIKPKEEKNTKPR